MHAIHDNGSADAFEFLPDPERDAMADHIRTQLWLQRNARELAEGDKRVADRS